MTDTPIADMVEKMLSTGIPVEMIIFAVRSAELAMGLNTRASVSVDPTTAKRRAWDRERKARKSGGIPPETENPPLILTSSPINDPINSKEESKKVRANSTGIPPEFHRKRAKLAPVPDDWKPPQRAFNLAVSLGLQVEDIEPRFRDYLASSGKQYLDYDAGFCNFIRNTPKFNGGTNGLGRSGPLQNNSSSHRAGILAEQIERGELDFGPVPRLLHEADENPVRLLSKG